MSHYLLKRIFTAIAIVALPFYLYLRFTKTEYGGLKDLSQGVFQTSLALSYFFKIKDEDQKGIEPQKRNIEWVFICIFGVIGIISLVDYFYNNF